jgi:small-conductance mechanosensitive channel
MGLVGWIRIFDSWEKYISFAEQLTMSLFLIALIFLISKVITRVIKVQTHNESDRYNLMCIIRFLAIAFSIIVGSFLLFQNLYAAAVSFGLISLPIGFALQAPIGSLVACVYLIFRRTYLVSDRIQIKGLGGDVVSISYFDS